MSVTFESLSLSAPLLRALKALGYEEPTPIQAQSIPALLQGRDVLGIAQTGTGKTAAFGLPLLQTLSEERPAGRRPIRALILAPTRELAAQIGQSISELGAQLDLVNTVIFGGVNAKPQIQRLRRGVDILVATPGRLLDLMGQGELSLDDVEIFVLDEADRMLDMGFIHDIRRVLKVLPPERQNLLFSATMPKTIAGLAASFLHDPVRVEIVREASVASGINQRVMFVDRDDKRALLVQLLDTPDVERAIVFTRTKHGANRLTQQLTRAGFEAAAIHGNKSQNARVRALDGFKDGSIPVLVATDVAARGIDVDDVSHVFNYELPNEPESYVHRIGRTARAGREGVAIAFCDATERAYLRDIERLVGHEVPVDDSHEFHSEEAANAKGSEPAPAPSRGRNDRSRSRPSGGSQGGQQGGARGPQRSAPQNAPRNNQPPGGSAGTPGGDPARKRRRRPRRPGSSSGPKGTS